MRISPLLGEISVIAPRIMCRCSAMSWSALFRATPTSVAELTTLERSNKMAQLLFAVAVCVGGSATRCRDGEMYCWIFACRAYTPGRGKHAIRQRVTGRKKEPPGGGTLRKRAEGRLGYSGGVEGWALWARGADQITV